MHRHVRWRWVAALLASGSAFALHLAVRSETVRLGYEVQEETAQLMLQRERVRMLEIERQMLRRRERVRFIAERSLGLTPADRARVMAVNGRAAR